MRHVATVILLLLGFITPGYAASLSDGDEISVLRQEVEQLRIEMDALKQIPLFAGAIKRHCEAQAVLYLKNYCTAQITYSAIFSKYASNYSLLNSVEFEGKSLELVSKRFLKARATLESPPDASLDGYVFLDDPSIRNWSKEFGLFAVPIMKDVGDLRIFWIGAQQRIYMLSSEEASNLGPPDIFVSPPASKVEWKPLG